LALARTLIRPTGVCILDEPLKASVEPDLRTEVRSVIRAIQESRNQTMLVISHDPEDLFELAESMMVMGTRPVEIRAINDALASPTTLGMAEAFGPLVEIRGCVSADGHTLLTACGPITIRPPLVAPAALSNIQNLWRTRSADITVREGQSFRIATVKTWADFSIFTLTSYDRASAETLTLRVLPSHQFVQSPTCSIDVRGDRLLLFDGEGVKVYPVK
jgi:ABC-type sugar transport system ATPase subunit